QAMASCAVPATSIATPRARPRILPGLVLLMTSMILQRRRNSTPKLLRADYESKKTGPLPTTTTTYNTTGSEVDNMPHWGRVTDECADDEGTTTKTAVWTTSTTTTTEAALVACDRSPLTLWPH
ncbi:hypothetical protein FOL46_003904, partial [Perkinsus olseni]